MPVIPGTMLPQPPGGGVRHARASMAGVRFLPRGTGGADALAALGGLAEKAAGLWLQANIKAKEAKAAMDLDEIRVKAEAAYRDNMTALSQDPDGYETFGDRSQENFLTLREDCRELLDGLPAEHRRKAELYLTGQAARWRDDTSRLQYQARVTALSGRAALSVQNQLDANDWNGARDTVRVAVEQGVYTRAKGDALLADIGHREAFAAALDDVKANPARAAGYLEKNDDGSWKMDIPGINPQDRERLARHGEELCRENAKELRDAMSADPGNFDPQAVEYKRLDGQISDRDAEKLLAVHRACLDRESAQAFDYSLLSAFDTMEKVAAAREALKDDGTLSELERSRRDAHLAAHGMRLKARDESEASKEQSEFYSEQKMRILYPGLFGDGEKEEITSERVTEWVKEKKLTYGQGYDLLHTGISIREGREAAARKLQSRRAAVSATVAIEELEVPADPAERKRVFDELDGQLYGRFFADEPDTYKRLSDRLVERFSPDPRGWRKNEELRNGWEAYLDEQKEKGFFSVKTVEEPIYMYSGFGMMAGRPREARTRDHAEESLLKWRGLMYDWLERNPKATEKELREYGDALRVRINAAHVGGELDELFAAAEASLRGTDIRRRREGGEGK